MRTTGKQPGRRSIANITTLRPVITAPRMQKPPELQNEEAEIFLQIVNSEEAAWFSPSSTPLLVQYCRHVVQARRIAELLEKHFGHSEPGWNLYADLLKQQRAESAALAQLATKLRISPQALRNDRGHLHSPAASESRPVPWQETDDA